jgi:alkanesulfonate monooxygenase SsuD/methylene tetrahydromethanopterin reductase-like flavin-dependent oxidoreductase (luciferase family)
VQYGFYTSNFGDFGSASLLVELAREAEACGWDGFFIWDHLQFIEPAADPWVALTAMALRTQRIRLGPLVTPLPRRHIGKLAREVATLDHLSKGRLIFGVGAGYPDFPEYAAFGDESDPKRRAAMLDEGLEVLAALLGGQPVDHHGVHYRIACNAFQPAVQQPRVPIWVAATWPAERTIRRAARWAGIVPMEKQGFVTGTADFARIVSMIESERGGRDGFDFIRFGATRDSRDRDTVAASAEAGATWWIESINIGPGSLEAAWARLRDGPPRIEA